MKFSVLLPTHDRLDLLRYAVESVIRQDHDDWELIISDNFSKEDILGYVRQLNDPRIKYVRTSQFVPVTENWNNATDQAAGDYVIMLGDDDALMPGYFTTLQDLLAVYGEADIIFTDAHIFAYPGVLPKYPTGFLRLGSVDYFPSREPFWLDREAALHIVRKTLEFELCVPFNMQHSAVNIKFVEMCRDRGLYFQSLYPDYYATTVGFLRASRILICKQPLVVIGITPKSHGFYYFNNRSDEAKAILYDKYFAQELGDLEKMILPGDWILIGWLAAMVALCRNYPAELAENHLGFNMRAYRRQSAIRAMQGYFRDNTVQKDEYELLVRQLSVPEQLLYLWPVVLYKIREMLGPEAAIAIRKLIAMIRGRGTAIPSDEQYAIKGYNTILDVIERAPTHLSSKA